MKKKTLIIILLSIAVIALGVYAVYVNVGKQPIKEEPEKIKDCAKIENAYIKNGCYMNLAVTLNDSVHCSSILDIDEKDMCYLKMSEVLGDKSVCANILDKAYLMPRCEARFRPPLVSAGNV